MADRKTCSCGACVQVANVPPHNGIIWLFVAAWCDDVVSCPHCGDHLLPGGDKIPAADLRAAWNAMQAMREGKCIRIIRGSSWSEGAEYDVFFEAQAARFDVRGETPEAAVAELVEKQGGNDEQ